jgi:hypothetical protein
VLDAAVVVVADDVEVLGTAVMVVDEARCSPSS